MIGFDSFSQYLRDNPMPTKRLNKKGYTTIEINYERNDFNNTENDGDDGND